MRVRPIAAAAGLAIALAGCGDDGSDTGRGSAGGFFGTIAPVEEPGIVVVADPAPPNGAAEMTEADGHIGADHDEAAAGDASTGQASTGEAAAGDVSVADASAQNAAAGEATERANHGDDVASAGEHDAANGMDHAAEGDSDHDGDGGHADAVEPEAADAHGDDSGIVVTVEMDEYGYVLDRATVPVGEPVRFEFVNVGQIEHEAMFGSQHQQEEFAASDGHGDHGSSGHHGDIAAITLDAAASGEMTMIFDTPGEVLIGCHLPGHWEAGMTASFEVVAA